jgi:hypothetical protein
MNLAGFKESVYLKAGDRKKIGLSIETSSDQKSACGVEIAVVWNQSQSLCDSSHAGGATAQIITQSEISTGECVALGLHAEFVRKRDYALLANFP